MGWHTCRFQTPQNKIEDISVEVVFSMFCGSQRNMSHTCDKYKIPVLRQHFVFVVLNILGGVAVSGHVWHGLRVWSLHKHMYICFSIWPIGALAPAPVVHGSIGPQPIAHRPMFTWRPTGPGPWDHGHWLMGSLTHGNSAHGHVAHDQWPSGAITHWPIGQWPIGQLANGPLGPLPRRRGPSRKFGHDVGPTTGAPLRPPSSCTVSPTGSDR